MLILLSPSKTQEIGVQFPQFTLPQFLEKTQQLVIALQKYDQQSIMELMGVSDKLATSTRERFAAFRFPPQQQSCCQALLAFRGDVFSEIAADSYTMKDFSFAQQHLRVLSGLYGILRPLDLIQPYRLEIGGKYRPSENENLYQFWSSAITDSLNKICVDQHISTLLNLASHEYFKVVNQKRIKAHIVNVLFKQHKNGKLRTVAIHAKKARGALANHIITKRIRNIKDLAEFSYTDYIYTEELSNENELVFVQM